MGCEATSVSGSFFGPYPGRPAAGENFFLVVNYKAFLVKMLIFFVIDYCASSKLNFVDSTC